MRKLAVLSVVATFLFAVPGVQAQNWHDQGVRRGGAPMSHGGGAMPQGRGEWRGPQGPMGPGMGPQRHGTWFGNQNPRQGNWGRNFGRYGAWGANANYHSRFYRWGRGNPQRYGRWGNYNYPRAANGAPNYGPYNGSAASTYGTVPRSTNYNYSNSTPTAYQSGAGQYPNQQRNYQASYPGGRWARGGLNSTTSTASTNSTTSTTNNSTGSNLPTYRTLPQSSSSPTAYQTGAGQYTNHRNFQSSTTGSRWSRRGSGSTSSTSSNSTASTASDSGGSNLVEASQ